MAISEPIKTIIDLLINKPERFEFQLYDNNTGWMISRHRIGVIDKKTNFSFILIVDLMRTEDLYISGLPWISQEESIDLARTAFLAYKGETTKQKESERSKWANIYCGEN